MAPANQIVGRRTTAKPKELDVPVLEQGGDGQMANCASSMVTGLKATGDGFLAVRSGPGSKYRKIDELHNGDVVLVFEQRGNGRRCLSHRERHLFFDKDASGHVQKQGLGSHQLAARYCRLTQPMVFIIVTDTRDNAAEAVDLRPANCFRTHGRCDKVREASLFGCTLQFGTPDENDLDPQIRRLTLKSEGVPGSSPLTHPVATAFGWHSEQRCMQI